ncbi:MAG: M67 family metallopeptidase [Campylobacteraceae bacterium]|jgi:proteasome lid subunit RPN8/RPN11|nr:M67 family metallopeptidase [Campylobacteraceae bacterium]
MGYQMIVLNDNLTNEIKTHAKADYPYECCGIILGKIENSVKITLKLLPISNAKDEANRHNRFLITDAEFTKASIYALKNGYEILGFYHSHPDHPSAPSKYDLDHAWPFYSYIIVSVEKGEAKLLTSWELENDRTKFNQETIIKGE